MASTGKHSLAPPLYEHAGRALLAVLRGTGLKAAVYSSSPPMPSAFIRPSYAVVTTALKLSAVLNEVCEKVDLQQVLQVACKRGLSDLDTAAAVCMVLDIMRGQRVSGSGPLRATVQQLKDSITSATAACMAEAGVSKLMQLVPQHVQAAERAAALPKYARMNWVRQPDLAELPAVLQAGAATPSVGKKRPRAAAADSATNLLTAAQLEPAIPGLLRFPLKYGAALATHCSVQDGGLVLQDKSSCFPAAALLLDPTWLAKYSEALTGGDKPPRGFAAQLAAVQTLWPPQLAPELQAVVDERGELVVLDGCAAPGNKTSHVAGILEACGVAYKVIAFEKDARRAGTLRKRMAQMGCDKVQVVEQDFLAADPQDAAWSAVSAILLDPSCSGSGMVRRLDHLLRECGEEVTRSAGILGSCARKQRGSPGMSPETAGVPATRSGPTEAERLAALAEFQTTAVQHALSWPQLVRMTYSTCSVHECENEEVVRAALRATAGGKRPFTLAPALPSWTRRGHAVTGISEPEQQSMLRVQPMQGDDTAGFFCALFVVGARPLSASAARRARKVRKAQKQHAAHAVAT